MTKGQQIFSHKPVMLHEVLSDLDPRDGEVYVDATFGAGGYTRAILESAQCTVIAIDRDETAQEIALGMKKEFGDRLIFVHAPFSRLKDILRDSGFKFVNGIVLDIGISSMQIDDPERGFSFLKAGPLDMRMGTGCSQSAADMLACISEEELADLIWQYGEEKHSRRIAKEIVRAREHEDILTTSRLAEIVRSAVPGHQKPGHDKATKTFQAIRIAVNDELGELREVLKASLDVLSDQGRLVVVCFHSLEDRLVKKFIRSHANMNQRSSRHMPDIPEQNTAKLKLLRKKALKPGKVEIDRNPRARSARLRTAYRQRQSGGFLLDQGGAQ